MPSSQTQAEDWPRDQAAPSPNAGVCLQRCLGAPRGWGSRGRTPHLNPSTTLNFLLNGTSHRMSFGKRDLWLKTKNLRASGLEGELRHLRSSSLNRWPGCSSLGNREELEPDPGWPVCPLPCTPPPGWPPSAASLGWVGGQGRKEGCALISSSYPRRSGPPGPVGRPPSGNPEVPGGQTMETRELPF